MAARRQNQKAITGDDKSQVEAFRKAARETGADEASEDQFKDALRMIAKAKPAQKNEGRTRKRSGG